MSVKRLLPTIVTPVVLFLSASASADTVNVDFSFTGDGSASGGTWSWAGGGSTLFGSFDDAKNFNSNAISNETVVMTTVRDEGALPSPSAPEPSQLFLLGTGLFVLAAFIRTRHRRRH